MGFSCTEPSVSLTVHEARAIEHWFASMTAAYRKEEPDPLSGMAIKAEHCSQVCRIIRDIGAAEGLSGGSLRFAGILGLLHDAGRFPQYARYHTFDDRRSGDHAELGACLIQEAPWFKSLGPDEARVLVRAVRYHNRKDIPLNEEPDVLLFSRLVRDADKVDIYRVVTEYYERKNPQRNQAVELDLPDPPAFSGQICRDILEGRMIRSADMRSLNDFKLLQMSWILDVNFTRTFQLIRRGDYLRRIRMQLPDSADIDRVYGHLDSQLRNGAGESRTGKQTGFHA